MFSNEAPAAARGVLFAVTTLPRLRQALRTTATPRFWVRFEKAFLVAPAAARGGAHVLIGVPSAPQDDARRTNWGGSTQLRRSKQDAQ